MIFHLFVRTGICDDKYFFEWVSIKSVGSSHDSLAFSATALYSRLENQGCLDMRNSTEPAAASLPPEKKVFWLAGDDAYVASEAIVTPWSGMRHDVAASSTDASAKAKASFNFYLSSLRGRIEQTFGIVLLLTISSFTLTYYSFSLVNDVIVALLTS